MGQLIFDANVVVRVLCSEVAHPKYSQAVAALKNGGIIRDYVMPEIIYAHHYRERVKSARSYAVEHNELPQFEAGMRAYTQSIPSPEGFKKGSYASLRSAMNQLLMDYPEVFIDDKELYDSAMGIACDTGHDWVDCMLLAEKQLRGQVVCSLDQDVDKNRGGVSPMALV